MSAGPATATIIPFPLSAERERKCAAMTPQRQYDWYIQEAVRWMNIASDLRNRSGGAILASTLSQPDAP